MVFANVIYAGEKVVKVSIFDFRGKLDRLKKCRTSALWNPPIDEEGEVELREKNDKNVV